MTDIERRAGATKVVMLHMNYRSRAVAHGDFPAHPTYYLKPPSTIAPASGIVERPAGCELLIAEAEVALIIGQRAHRVPQGQGWQYVSHVAAANDFTVLDFMYADPSLTRVKGWDGFTPLGDLVDARTIDPFDLNITMSVNGEERQGDSTATLLFPFGDLVTDLSGIMTLEAGDIILTGTPAGAGPVFPGDEVVVEIVDYSRVRTVIADAKYPLPPLCPPPRVTPAQRAHALGVAAARPALLDEPHWDFLRSGSVRTLFAWLAERGIAAEPLELALAEGSPTVAGHAFTVRLLPGRRGETASLTKSLRPVESVGRNEVVVVAANADTGAPALPRDTLEHLVRNGAEGLVTDSRSLIPEGSSLPCAAPKGSTSNQSYAYETTHRVADLNSSVALCGVTIDPGDVIVSDSRGSLLLTASGLTAFKDTELGTREQ